MIRKRLIRIFAWVIVIAGYALVTAITGTAAVAFAINAWPDVAWAIGGIIVFFGSVLLWCWAKDYTQEL